jgi:hypothetical protein
MIHEPSSHQLLRRINPSSNTAIKRGSSHQINSQSLGYFVEHLNHFQDKAIFNSPLVVNVALQSDMAIPLLLTKLSGS